MVDEASASFGTERALFFSSGYAANGTLLPTLPQRGDLVVHDSLIHTGVGEGLPEQHQGPQPRRRPAD